VLIMAKAPRPGQVKTRLEPLLGPGGCAELQRELIRHTAAWVGRLDGPAWLAHAPADARAELSQLVPDGMALLPQLGGDLGRRLRAAASAVGAARHDGPLAVIGADAPGLGPAHVDAAARVLAAGYDACLVPALDGGYAMIALARPELPAFGIPAAAWGGPDVLRLTLGALRGAGLRVICLDPVADLDTPADAAALCAHPACPPRVRQALQPGVAA
jgi:rSAM/selenodomain-associated transferase 1